MGKTKEKLPGRRGIWGGVAKDNRKFINAAFWILRTGFPWRDLPPDYGDQTKIHRRFCRWRGKGIQEGLPDSPAGEPDLKWLMIDAGHIKVHPHAAGAKVGNQKTGRTKGGGSARSGILPWMYMVNQSGSSSHQEPWQIVPCFIFIG